MLYLACLIRAREPEDKSGWLEDVSPLRVVNRGGVPWPEKRVRSSQRWSTALFEFIPAFSIRREIALMKEASIVVYRSKARGRCTRETSFMYSAKWSNRWKIRFLPLSSGLGKRRIENRSIRGTPPLPSVVFHSVAFALSRVETISKLSFRGTTRGPRGSTEGSDVQTGSYL